MSFLEVDNLTIAYGSKSVVKKCSFELEEGEIGVILGASGEGKTSLLKGIAGLLPYKYGGVYFNGEKVKDAKKVLVPGHKFIKLVNQDFELDINHTVEENIRLKLLAFDKVYQKQRISSLLRLCRLTSFKSFKASEISGGQQQRLAIARALADEPDLLLLDEPFNQLDFQTKTKIASHVKRYLKQNNITALMVTHNGLEAMEWADKIIYMENGRIKRIDTPENFFNKPHNKKEASFFGEINKLKVKDEIIYFRPSFFSNRKSKTYSVQLKIEFKYKQNLGWYSSYTFSFENQLFQLFSTSDISDLKKINIKPIQFND
jgi:ABC-type Fe3+/spermidine/putrescine transport system ATPase subunit